MHTTVVIGVIALFTDGIYRMRADHLYEFCSESFLRNYGREQSAAATNRRRIWWLETWALRAHDVSIIAYYHYRHTGLEIFRMTRKTREKKVNDNAECDGKRKIARVSACVAANVV